MVESLYAHLAEVGQQYVTKSGWPVTILQQGITLYQRPALLVRNDATGDQSKIYDDTLLWPYDRERINKEAITMAKAKSTAVKSEKSGTRGGARGARKEQNGIVLFREIGGEEHKALYLDGVIIYKGKDYLSLKEVASAVAGKLISGSGRSFFGLRVAPNIGLGEEVWEGLKQAAEIEKPEVKKAPKKAKRVVEDEDDDKPVAKSVGEAVAKVFGRGRR